METKDILLQLRNEKGLPLFLWVPLAECLGLV